MANASSYNELEFLILAMVGEGVNSGYSMRKEMNRMRGGRWSAESGSVYRILRRLVRDGMVIEARKAGVPNRERTEYELTKEGDVLLRSWLTFPPDRAEMAFLVDPLRTRCYFLFRLKPEEQIQTVKSWLQESRSFLQELERDIAAIATTAASAPRAVAYQNLLHLGQARHEWLKKLLYSIRQQSSFPAEPYEDEEVLAKL